MQKLTRTIKSNRETWLIYNKETAKTEERVFIVPVSLDRTAVKKRKYVENQLAENEKLIDILASEIVSIMYAMDIDKFIANAEVVTNEEREVTENE